MKVSECAVQMWDISAACRKEIIDVDGAKIRNTLLKERVRVIEDGHV